MGLLIALPAIGIGYARREILSMCIEGSPHRAWHVSGTSSEAARPRKTARTISRTCFKPIYVSSLPTDAGRRRFCDISTDRGQRRSTAPGLALSASFATQRSHNRRFRSRPVPHHSNCSPTSYDKRTIAPNTISSIQALIVGEERPRLAISPYWAPSTPEQH